MPPHQVSAYNTYQFTDYSKYVSDLFSEENKRRQRDEQFPKDLQTAFNVGVKVAHEIQDETVIGHSLDDVHRF
ncbi:MAG: hypothetical protein NC111_05865 [Bacteroides sp.]|nr:hypothetical protein [Bacteroides sp.]MCM1414213.1 hypothetical protein [Bacteroides sp.]MCM1472035.1 hypothetical protein [Bacteroides sp.]